MENHTGFRYLTVSILGMLSLLAIPTSIPPRPWQNTQAASDVSLTMLADRSIARVGQNVTYTAARTNLGPSDATFVDVAFTLPAGLRIVSMSCDMGISPDGPFCEY